MMKILINIILKYLIVKCSKHAKYRFKFIFYFTYVKSLMDFIIKLVYKKFLVYYYYLNYAKNIIIFKLLTFLKNYKINEKGFLNIVVFGIFKLIKVFLKLLIHYINNLIYIIWIFVGTLLLELFGYFKLSFGIGYIYNLKYDYTPQDIVVFVKNFFNFLKRNYLSINYLNYIFSLLFNFFLIFILTLKRIFYYFIIDRYIKKLFKSLINIYVSVCAVIFLILNMIIFYKKLFFNFKFIKNKKKVLKKYIYSKYFWFFLKFFFRKNKIFIKFKKSFFYFKFKYFFRNTYYKKHRKKIKKIIKKLKYGIYDYKKWAKYRRIFNKIIFKRKLYSTQKRFLYFYIKLLKKNKKILVGVLRLIYIDNLWIYSFNLKNYMFSASFNLYIIINNFLDLEYIYLIVKLVILWI